MGRRVHPVSLSIPYPVAMAGRPRPIWPNPHAIRILTEKLCTGSKLFR
jgi:hypothetical protein